MTDLHQDVELVETDELIPYTNNPKEHPESQVKKIASSIKNYGWDQPIVVDGENEIIKGHGRLDAAELLELDKVPVIRRGDLNDAKKQAARIADNKTAESSWNDELLATELDVLDDIPEIDMESVGFEDNEVEELLDDGVPDPADEVDLGLDAEYEVIVECNDEQHQEEVYNSLQGEGYECRLNSL